jgi:poly(3-hydroxybutyrate) depolymerase
LVRVGTCASRFIDTSRIYLAGYSLGGNVALHAAALDDRVAGVASFAGFTPMRSDTADKPTGGIRRLYEMHALAPKLGLFADEKGGPSQTDIPYDYEEMIASLAPKPVLLYTPTSDRDATYTPDVEQCVAAAAAVWEAKGASANFSTAAPNAVTKMETVEVAAAISWLKKVAKL